MRGVPVPCGRRVINQPVEPCLAIWNYTAAQLLSYLSRVTRVRAAFIAKIGLHRPLLAQSTTICRAPLTLRHRHDDNVPLRLSLCHGRQPADLCVQQYSFHQSSFGLREWSPDGMYTYHTQTTSPRSVMPKKWQPMNTA